MQLNSGQRALPTGRFSPTAWQTKFTARVPELDGIRGIAVSLILAQHFWPNSGAWGVLSPIADVGWIGVDLFFVLSGFLITGLLLDTTEDPDYFRSFYLRRAFRVFPLYYTFLLAAFGFLASWHHGLELAKLQRIWGSPIWFFSYLANFVTVSKRSFPLFAPLGPPWSLQIEEQFYMLFPVIVKYTKRRLTFVLVVLAAFALAWRLSWLVLDSANAFVQYCGTISRLDALALGGIAALCLRSRRSFPSRRALGWFMPLSLISLTAFYLKVGTATTEPLIRTIGYSINAITFAALVLWAVQRQKENVTVFFRIPILRWLGKISYGVYLLQLPAQTAVKLITNSPLIGTIKRDASFSAICIAVTIILAWLSWHCLEKPLQEIGKKLTSPSENLAVKA